MRLLGKRLGVVVTVVSALGLAVACGSDDGGGDGDGDGDGSGGEQGDGDGDGSGGEQGDGDGDGTGGRNAPSGGMGGEDNMGGGGMGGGGPIDECDTDVTFPTELSVTPRDDSNPWGVNDFDDATIEYAECGAAIVTAILPHEVGWEDADPSESNSEQTHFEVQGVYYPLGDLTDKMLNLTIKLLDDGRSSSAENGGFNVYLGAIDGDDYTEASTPWDGDHDNVNGDSNYPGYSGSLYNANDEVKLSIALPTGGAFDAAGVYKIFVRIENKNWSGPVFDYDEAQFEISNLSVDDAP